MIDTEKVSGRMYDLRLSQAELARKTGLSPGYISDLLNGRRGKRLGGMVLLKLAKALEVDPIFFAESFVYANEEEQSDIRKIGKHGGN